MATPRNVVVFGTPLVDRRFVIKLAGIPQILDDSPAKLFETKKYSVTISNQPYTFYNTTGLAELSNAPLDPRNALGSLHGFTSLFAGTGVHLLIYVVDNELNELTTNNYLLFYDYFCQEGSPIILVTTNPKHVNFDSRQFKFSKVLVRPSADELQKAIASSVKKKPMVVSPTDRFEKTSMKSWTLLEREARWTLSQCREALKKTLILDGLLGEVEAAKKCRQITEFIKRHYFRNVIVFGNTGAGKTSVIKMLAPNCELPPTTSSAGGSTLQTMDYKFDIGEYHYRIHDTVGLNDATTSAALTPHTAVRDLYQLITKVNSEGGISLLVYVHRGKIEPSNVANYKLFNDICPKQVPIALVVTALEEEEDWWKENESLFQRAGMQTKYRACITSTKGKASKGYPYQQDYADSQRTLENLFLYAPLPSVWKVKTASWLKTAFADVYMILARRFNWGPKAGNKWLQETLILNGRVSGYEATPSPQSLESL